MARRASAAARPMDSPRRLSLTILLEAKDVADETGADNWELASQLKTFHDFGVTDATLRWLIMKGFAEHRLETTRPRQRRRCFRATDSLRFNGASCFVITPAGAALARNGALTTRADRACDHVPHFDPTSRTLFVGPTVVKTYKVPARNQELILQAFEEEHWPCHLDDPLPPHAEHDSKHRLHAAIDRLNRCQKNPMIRFHGDGTGRGICWELTAEDARPAERAARAHYVRDPSESR